MGFILNLPPLAPPDGALTALYMRLSTEYAMMRTSYRESLSEALIIKLCDRLAVTFNCRKQSFQKTGTNTNIKYAGSNGALLSIVISPDGYGAGTAQSRPCPSCAQIYNGKAKLGGLGWTNAHNIINHGKIGPAVELALDDTLKRGGSTSDARLMSGAADIKAVIDLIKGKAEGYGGPAVSFGAGEQCPICEKIHASDCLIQRHYRCKLHVQAGNTYRSIKIDGTDYVRGNEAIVGIQFGATRAKPDGALAHLTAFTHSMAGKIAGEVLLSLSELYDKREAKYNQSFVMDLLLLQDNLTWAVRKRLIDAASGPLSALPPDRVQVVLMNPVVPPATAIPVIPPPTVLAYSVPPAPPPDAAPPPVPVSAVGPIGTIPDPPVPLPQPIRRAPDSTWPLYIGSLKQRLLRAPYATYGVERMQRAAGYRPDLVPKLAEYTDAREKLHYMLDQFWAAFKEKKLAEPIFQQLVREFALIGFDKVRGPKIARLKVEMGLR
jgi:hypothetical protein